MILAAILANAPPAPDAMISGNWIIAVIGAIAAGIALVIGKMQGRKEATETRLTTPVPEVPTRKVSTPPSWDAHTALVDRVSRQEQISNELRHDLSEVRKDMAIQYREIMKAGSEREANLSDKLDGIARSIHARIDELMKPKSPR